MRGSHRLLVALTLLLLACARLSKGRVLAQAPPAQGCSSNAVAVAGGQSSPATSISQAMSEAFSQCNTLPSK